MEEMLAILGFLVGVISCLIIGAFLSANHITKIIGILIGAVQCYVLFYLGIGPDGALGWFVVGSLVLVLFAAYFAICEVVSFINFAIEMLGGGTSSKPSTPSPNSHVIGGLVNLIMSFFR